VLIWGAKLAPRAAHELELGAHFGVQTAAGRPRGLQQPGGQVSFGVGGASAWCGARGWRAIAWLASGRGRHQAAGKMIDRAASSPPAE